MSKLKLLLLLWLMLVGFASGYSQEIVKCIVIETNSVGNVECYLSKHPKLTQNNDVVTLTTDDAVTEFSTTDIKKVYFGEDKYLYKLVYYVDDELYKTYKYEVGEAITPEEAPTKEGYSFSGWSDIPNTMPAKDVTVTGTFSVNKYKLVYKVDGEEYKSYDVEYGASITPEAEPTKEGYSFSGWSDIPNTMPAKDVTVTGTFTVNKYKLVYKVDGEEYKSYDVEYGASITPETEPTKEGYTFSGWSDIPNTMPAKNVTVTGTFTVNKYKLVYKVDGEEYKSYDVEYGASITPETEPTKEGYTFSGWSDIPNTMPAKNVTVTGTFTINKYTVSYVIDNEVFQEDKLEFGAKIIPPEAPKRDGFDFSWGEYPETMPAKNIVITGTYVTGINGLIISSVLQYNGDYYTLNGLDANESVFVYSASGEIILRSIASEKGELIIRTTQLSNGVNIIKTKNQSFKVIRK